jgi:hypothetical protein
MRLVELYLVDMKSSVTAAEGVDLEDIFADLEWRIE